MVRFAVLVAAFGLFVPLVAGEEKFTSKDGKFSAIYPKAPKEFSTPDADVKPADGRYKYFSASHELSKDVAYMVMYHDYLPGKLGGDPQLVLERVRNGWRGSEGRVLEDRELSLGADKVPGRAFTVKHGDNMFRVRAFLKDLRLYQVIVTGKTREDITAETADKFLNSFEIAK